MALLHTGDRICASCGGMNGKHRPGCIGDDTVEVISTAANKQSRTASLSIASKLQWVRCATAFHRYVWPIDEEANLPPDQSLEGRFWDVVWMFHAAVKGAVPAQRIDPCNLLFDFYCIVADPALSSNERIDATARSGPEGMRLVTLTAVSGPGDDGEPVMTLMLPDED